MNTSVSQHKSIGTKIMYRTAIGVVAGVTVGVMIELIVSWATSTTYVPGTPLFLSQFANEHLAVLAERLLYALLGAVCSCSALIWENEDRSILANTCLHYVIVGSSLCAAGYTLRWFPPNIAAVLGFVVVTLIYALIWVGKYLQAAHEIKRMNQEIAQR